MPNYLNNANNSTKLFQWKLIEVKIINHLTLDILNCNRQHETHLTVSYFNL